MNGDHAVVNVNNIYIGSPSIGIVKLGPGGVLEIIFEILFRFAPRAGFFFVGMRTVGDERRPGGPAGPNLPMLSTADRRRQGEVPMAGGGPREMK